MSAKRWSQLKLFGVVVVSNLLTAGFVLSIVSATLQREKDKYTQFLKKDPEGCRQNCRGAGIVLSNDALVIDPEKGVDVDENWELARTQLSDRDCTIVWERAQILQFPGDDCTAFGFKPKPIYK